MAQFLAYRVNFFNELIATSVWTALIIATMLLLTDKATMVAGWTQGEMLLLSATIIIILGIFEIHFKRSFFLLSDTIFYGRLDGLLVKPVDSQFMVSFSSYKIMGIWRMMIGIIFLIVVLHKFHIVYTGFQLLQYIILVIVGNVIYYSLWFMMATLLIWNPRLSNILDVMNSMNHASRFPPEMFKEFNIFLFLFLFPYMILVSTPVKMLLHKATIEDISVLIITACGMFCFTRWLWNYSLRYYTSASG